MEAATTGRAVLVPDLGDAFVALADTLIDDHDIIDLLDQLVAHCVSLPADVATIGILSERAIRHGEVLNEQLQTAPNSRVIIEQAEGVLAQHLGVSTGTRTPT